MHQVPDQNTCKVGSIAGRLDRRTALKWFLTVAALRWPSAEGWSVDAGSVGPAPPATGYGTDPDLLNPTTPWPRTLTVLQFAQVRVLADLMIPADDRSPAASDAGVVDFIDEWISAPYPEQRQDRAVILAGIERLDSVARRQYRCGFEHCSRSEQTQLLEQQLVPKVDRGGASNDNAVFFIRLRYLVTGGFYTSPIGLVDLQYFGDAPVVGEFPGPSTQALAALNLALRKLQLDPVDSVDSRAARSSDSASAA